MSSLIAIVLERLQSHSLAHDKVVYHRVCMEELLSVLDVINSEFSGTPDEILSSLVKIRDNILVKPNPSQILLTQLNQLIADLLSRQVCDYKS
jgi:hypothetical protein